MTNDNYRDKNTSLHVSLRTRKFDKKIVAEIVSLLKKIYKRDAPFRAVFKVKTLAVLVLAYPREMKHIPRNLNLPPFWRCLFLWKWCNPFPRARTRLKHAHSFDRCGGQRSRFLVLTKRSAASGDENENYQEVSFFNLYVTKDTQYKTN